MQLLNTLYVTTPESYLRLENNTLRIELEDEVKLRGFAAVSRVAPRGSGLKLVELFLAHDGLPVSRSARLYSEMPQAFFAQSASNFDRPAATAMVIETCLRRSCPTGSRHYV